MPGCQPSVLRLPPSFPTARQCLAARYQCPASSEHLHCHWLHLELTCLFCSLYVYIVLYSSNALLWVWLRVRAGRRVDLWLRSSVQTRVSSYAGMVWWGKKKYFQWTLGRNAQSMCVHRQSVHGKCSAVEWWHGGSKLNIKQTRTSTYHQSRERFFKNKLQGEYIANDGYSVQASQGHMWTQLAAPPNTKYTCIYTYIYKQSSKKGR